MMRITVNNITMTKEKAIKTAIEVNDQTGIEVEVCNILGDPIIYVKEDGMIIKY